MASAKDLGLLLKQIEIRLQTIEQRICKFDTRLDVLEELLLAQRKSLCELRRKDDVKSEPQEVELIVSPQKSLPASDFVSIPDKPSIQDKDDARWKMLSEHFEHCGLILRKESLSNKDTLIAREAYLPLAQRALECEVELWPILCKISGYSSKVICPLKANRRDEPKQEEFLQLLQDQRLVRGYNINSKTLSLDMELTEHGKFFFKQQFLPLCLRVVCQKILCDFKDHFSGFYDLYAEEKRGRIWQMDCFIVSKRDGIWVQSSTSQRNERLAKTLQLNECNLLIIDPPISENPATISAGGRFYARLETKLRSRLEKISRKEREV